MKYKFKDAPMGYFLRRDGLAYVKFSDTQACVITSGKVVELDPEEEIYTFDRKN